MGVDVMVMSDVWLLPVIAVVVAVMGVRKRNDDKRTYQNEIFHSRTLSLLNCNLLAKGGPVSVCFAEVFFSPAPPSKRRVF